MRGAVPSITRLHGLVASSTKDRLHLFSTHYACIAQFFEQIMGLSYLPFTRSTRESHKYL